MVPPEPWSLGRQAPRAPSELGARIGASLGLTNGVERRSSGMTNGLGGRTNGLTTGLRGHTNGLVNGLRAGGRTNGVGYTNGLPLRQNPFGVATTPPTGIVMTTDKNGTYPWPTSSCVTQLYDLQQTFDNVRQRFWIVSAARSTSTT